MKHLNRFSVFVLAALLIVALASAPLSAQDEVTLTFGISSGVDTLDNTATTFSSVEIIVGHVFDTLVKQQPLGVYHPGLATDWSVSDDATEYVFNLRDDVTFHDGTPFNAEAVKYTFDRIVDPDTKIADGFQLHRSLRRIRSAQRSQYRRALLVAERRLPGRRLAPATGAGVADRG